MLKAEWPLPRKIVGKICKLGRLDKMTWKISSTTIVRLVPDKWDGPPPNPSHVQGPSVRSPGRFSRMFVKYDSYSWLGPEEVLACFPGPCCPSSHCQEDSTISQTLLTIVLLCLYTMNPYSIKSCCAFVLKTTTEWGLWRAERCPFLHLRMQSVSVDSLRAPGPLFCY